MSAECTVPVEQCGTPYCVVTEIVQRGVSDVFLADYHKKRLQVDTIVVTGRENSLKDVDCS